MPIIGIDGEKCSICKECIKDCPTRNFMMDADQDHIIYDGSRCILCDAMPAMWSMISITI